MLFSFRLAIFLGAGLLFVIQPMFAKMVLPMLGGSPAVWNTCMLFFQGMLLAGYAYAHLSQRWLGSRAQVIVHLVLLAVVMLLPAMTVSAAWNPPDDDTPIFWLLGLLFVVVGGPFFAVSATSPLLQQWFSATGHARAHNPYFLYAASNAGSMIALLAYPFLIERIFSLGTQADLWRYAYFAFVASMIGCAWFVFRNQQAAEADAKESNAESGSFHSADVAVQEESAGTPESDISWKQRLLWIALAFVPSSWMLGVTSFLTTDITPMPILWIIPLTIYLITFIIAFSDKPILPADWLIRAFPVAMLVLVATTILQGGFLVLALHLVIFFVGAMTCHFELSKQRPSTRHLTEFYLWISLGGLLGGVFNGLIAPLCFPWILEYPLTLMLACALCRSFEPELTTSEKVSESQLKHQKQEKSAQGSKQAKGKKAKQKNNTPTKPLPPANDETDFARKIKLGSVLLFALIVAILVNVLGFQGTSLLILATLFGLAALCFLFLVNQPIWFSLPLGAVLILAKLEPPQPGETVLYTGRGFFGVNRVVAGPQGAQIRLYHGTTVHGIQSADPDNPELRLEPLTYYHRTGPLGMIFAQAQEAEPFDKVGIVGLGAGTAAAYHRTDQKFVFYEIDPIVKAIAENPDYFTFLQECGAENYDIVLGDGRLKLSAEPDGTFDLLVFDAFSSDAIPIHLLTREAIEMYQTKLTDRGFLAFHISNLHFDLEPILGDIAAELDLESVTCHDQRISEEEMLAGKAPASYVVIAKNVKRTGLSKMLKWKPTRRTGRKRVWTDTFSNLFDALKSGGER